MHPATELILARMESNPEEFSNGGRWAAIVQTMLQHAPKEECDAVKEKGNAIRMDELHKLIMGELCSPTPQPPEQEVFPYTTYTIAPSIITSAEMKGTALKLLKSSGLA